MKSLLQNFRAHLRTFALPIVSGFLIGTSYIPFPPWALLFCFVPLWVFAFKQTSLKTLFIGGMITSFILSMIGFHWIFHTASAFGNLPAPISLLVLILFGLFCHLHLPLSLALWFYLRKRFSLSPVASSLGLAFCFILVDHFFPFLFRWNFGYPIYYAEIPVRHVAEWIGFEGLHDLMIFGNVIVFEIWRHRGNPQKMRPPMKIAAVVITLLSFSGWWLGRAPLPETKRLNALVVQGNIGNLEKARAEHGREYLDKILDTYIKLTNEGLQKHPDAHVVIWPETAYPEEIDALHRPLNQRLDFYLREIDRPLITGAYAFDRSTRTPYNGLYFLKDQLTTPVTGYRKTHLLAFGEYLPGAEYVPQIKEWFPFISSFGRGGGPEVVPFEGINWGAQICYEGLFPRFTAELNRKGAHVLINVTNDSWFGRPFEPLQHMHMTMARSIETRLPLIRSTNSGLTVFSDMKGNIKEMGPLHEPWWGFFEVDYPVHPKPTVYSQIAPYRSYLLIFFFLLWLTLSRLTSLRANVTSNRS